MHVLTQWHEEFVECVNSGVLQPLLVEHLVESTKLECAVRMRCSCVMGLQVELM
jgi:hypothetical protein